MNKLNLNNALNFALEGNAILFAGSGFSYGAKNMQGQPLSCGDELRDKIAADCGMMGTTQNLETVSQFFIKEKSVDALITLLKQEFTVRSVAQWHENIASVPWKRIYTTNYDSVIELSANKNNREMQSIVLSRSSRDYDLKKVCVHFNGHIENLNRNTLNKEFKLIDTSYACEKLDGNEWYEMFKDDLLTTKAIIIIGYSMKYDLDIKRLLSTPAIKKKAIIIDKKDLDKISASLLKDYGTCEFIGIEAFSNRLNEVREQYVPSVMPKCFESFVWEYRETMEPYNLKFSEINDFYTKGTMYDGIMSCNYGEYRYVVLRDKIDYVLRKLKTNKVFLILSDLGNGKTMFCNLLRDALRQENVDIYTLQNEHLNVTEEVSWICSSKERHAVVIIDDYKRSLRVMNEFKYQDTSHITADRSNPEASEARR